MQIAVDKSLSLQMHANCSRKTLWAKCKVFC